MLGGFSSRLRLEERHRVRRKGFLSSIYNQWLVRSFSGAYLEDVLVVERDSNWEGRRDTTNIRVVVESKACSDN